MNTDQKIARLEEILGRPFKNKRLAVESLNHGGLPISFKGLQETYPRSDRLALFGDSLLDTELRSRWYHARDDHGM